MSRIVRMSSQPGQGRRRILLVGSTARRPRVSLTQPLPRGWAVPTILAAPFVIGIAALRGVTVALPIFHGSDEGLYHYSTILRFARELPFPDLHSYPAAQTPLFHLLMAYIGKAVGYELWRLRLIEVLISYGLALTTYVLLHRRLRIQRAQAIVLTLLFVLSPYVLGGSFRLETDNLAMLFSVLALERLERFREISRLAPFVVACACIAAAILTRQSTGFLPLIALAYLLWAAARVSRRDRAVGLAAVGLSVLPAGLLFLNWHGLVPVGGDPSSCGLCGANAGGSGLTVATAELALATTGFYGAVMFAPQLIVALRVKGRSAAGRVALARESLGPLAVAAAGLGLLVIFPATPGAHPAGDVWRVASKLPDLDGSSVLFWVLVPLAGAVLWTRLRVAPSPLLAVALVLIFLATSVVIRYPWQKYIDPFALLVLLVTISHAEFVSPKMFAGVAVLALAFVVYALDIGAHQATTLAVILP